MSSSMLHNALVCVLPYVPRPLIQRLSRRYIAGVDVQAACRAVKELNAAGCSGTIDVLGEDSSSEDQVQAAVDLYLNAIREIHAASLTCGLSVKLSEFGLRYDVKRCEEAIRTLSAAAKKYDLFVRIDMEDSRVTSVTLDIYRKLRKQYDNLGVVIQSRLRRSAQDVAELLSSGPTDVRLCKGIYIEPESIAFTKPVEVSDSFGMLLTQLFEGGAKRVGIATHDRLLVKRAEESIRNLGVEKERYEFQMLLGVAGTLRREIVDKGHPLRVYVPFGELWYQYSIRRLRENPKLAGHIVRNLLSRA